MTWWALIALGVGAYALKAFGIFGLGRLLTGPLERLVTVLPAALFAGIVVAETLGSGSVTEIWTRTGGVAAGAVAHWAKAPLLVVIVVAAAVTAVLRQIVA